MWSTVSAVGVISKVVKGNEGVLTVGAGEVVILTAGMVSSVNPFVGHVDRGADINVEPTFVEDVLVGFKLAVAAIVGSLE